jgi:chromosome segregation ATPase
MLNVFRDELNSTIKQTTSNNMPVEDTVHDVNSPSKSTEVKSCQRCEQLTAERDQAIAELEAARKLVDRSEDMVSEMQLLSQETREQISICKQKIKEYQKRTVKVCWNILNKIPILSTFQSALLPIQLEEAQALLAELKSQLVSLEKTVYHLTNVEKELVDCRIALATTQKSHEEVQHTADARAEEIRILRNQLATVTVKTDQAKFGRIALGWLLLDDNSRIVPLS